MLEISNIEVAYGSVVAVRQVSMSVRDKEVVALIGNNGAGKTSILRAISGLNSPRCGSICFGGLRIDGLPAHRIAALGIIHVPEGRKIFSGLTVQENLAMGAYLVRDRKAVFREMEQVYELFPVLKERRFQPGGTLSGGEQQMLAIGRALMGRPKMLLLDEPSLGLAPLLVERIAEEITEIAASGLPILLVEQNAQIALEISSRAYVLEAGAISVSGPSRELRLDETVRKSYLGEE